MESEGSQGKLVTHSGIITQINSKKGFGFILTDEQEELFFHISGVIAPDFKELRAGHPVEFFIINDRIGGKPRAIGVCVA